MDIHTVSQKNDTDVAHYNFSLQFPSHSSHLLSFLPPSVEKLPPRSKVKVTAPCEHDSTLVSGVMLSVYVLCVNAGFVLSVPCARVVLFDQLERVSIFGHIPPVQVWVCFLDDFATQRQL